MLLLTSMAHPLPANNMNQAVFSIKPRFAELILDGNKQYEFRKRAPTFPVSKIIVYSSAPVRAVVGHFSVGSIQYKSIEALADMASTNTRQYVREYFRGRKFGFAIEIVNPIRYKRIKTLLDLGIKCAPQSFCYVS